MLECDLGRKVIFQTFLRGMTVVCCLLLLPSCSSGSSEPAGSGGAAARNPAEGAAKSETPAVQTTPQSPAPAATLAQEPEGKILKPGEFTWNPERAKTGPVVVIVSIPDQIAYAYRNGILIGRSTVSTGRPGHKTPTGVFHILQKEVKHFSSKYNNAPMPNMERLTWDGVAMHAGNLPGYPASHGCVRLPLEFSRLLYGVTSMGTTVVVADRTSAPEETVKPGMLLPASVSGTGDDALDKELDQSRFVWQPDRATDGPVSILMSGADAKVYVYRKGIRIGEAKLRIRNPEQPLTPGAYVVLEGFSSEKNVYVPDKPLHRWMAVGLPAKDGQLGSRDAIERVRMPMEFARKVYDVLQPGTTLMITDLPATKQTTVHHSDFTVMAGHDPAAETKGVKN